jgi:hypothetical protein
MKTGSWYNAPLHKSPEKRREIAGSTHYSANHGFGMKRKPSFVAGDGVVVEGLSGAMAALNKRSGRVVHTGEGNKVEVELDGWDGVHNAGLPVVLHSKDPNLKGRKGKLQTFMKTGCKYEVKLEDGKVARVPMRVVAFVVPSKSLRAPWNNRWHMSPSNLGAEIHGSVREYFEKPSRMYTSAAESWRGMLGDGCENWSVRKPGTPQMKLAYGWQALQLQRSETAPSGSLVGEL